MKITVELDDGTVVTFQSVTDAYLAVRQMEPMRSTEGAPAVMPETRSHSWGGNMREIVKELRQAVVELEPLLPKAKENGGC